MKVGAEISGTLTETGTGKPVPNMLVELIHPAPQQGNRQAFTDANGHYVFRALPEADDIIVFSPANGPINGSDIDGFGMQYYKGSATLAGAMILHAVPGMARTGIDGDVVNLNPPREKEPVTVTFLPTPRLLPPVHRVHCRKGFKKQKVRGKQHCVKIHKRKHHPGRAHAR